MQARQTTETTEGDLAARYHGVAVPCSDFLNEKRIERLDAGEYEGAEVRGALSVVTARDHVLELGAGIGVVGAAVALNCRPARMFSYEANVRLVPVIEKTYEINGLSGAIKLRNRVLLAGPDRPETVTFYLKNSYLGSSLADSDRRATTPVVVGTDSWEAMRAELAPSVLIMDIEGGELDLLRHADLDGIRAVILEFHPDVYGKPGMQEAKKILTDQGFAKQEDVSTRLVWTCTRAM